MKNCDRLLFLVFPLAVAIAASPYNLTAGWKFSEAVAFAKNDNGGGNGNGGGNSKGDGNGKADGKGGGNGGANGSGGNGKANGKGGGNGNPAPAGKDRGRGTIAEETLEFEYADGIRESIINGLYEMRDAQGRRIILRNATPKDRARLRGLQR